MCYKFLCSEPVVYISGWYSLDVLSVERLQFAAHYSAIYIFFHDCEQKFAY